MGLKPRNVQRVMAEQKHPFCLNLRFRIRLRRKSDRPPIQSQSIVPSKLHILTFSSAYAGLARILEATLGLQILCRVDEAIRCIRKHWSQYSVAILAQTLCNISSQFLLPDLSFVKKCRQLDVHSSRLLLTRSSRRRCQPEAYLREKSTGTALRSWISTSLPTSCKPYIRDSSSHTWPTEGGSC